MDTRGSQCPDAFPPSKREAQGATPSGTAGETDPHVTMTSAELLGDSHGSTTGSLIDNGRFSPGTLLGARYRIVELLGRGGMGEVYRVDDLKLGQPISLKFLNISLAQDAAGLNTLYQEARTARLVGHQNVCRVFDVGEFDGVPFISMEYVDGENLKSLLSRIGRVPHDKALEIARQLCRGLHAIHEQGLLHRDLKPTNVMIDGRGRARITDFGLAAAARDLAGSSNRAGTPAYMAPEQIAGRAVTTRSDLYSLGLILYELFTGKRVFSGQSWADFSRLHQGEEPTPPSALVADVDPAVERVILQCLEKDPSRRPVSAMAVLGALSGGDALAAVLAAGETPTPEMVAAARTDEGFTAPVALGALAAIVAVVLLIAGLNDAYSPLRHAKLNVPPAVLEDRARDIVRQLGYPGEPAGRKSGLRINVESALYVQSHDTRVDRWQRIGEGRVPVLGFWYRQSETPLIPANPESRVDWADPPPTQPGMIGVATDVSGALRQFYAVPTDYDPNGPPGARATKWDDVFRLARLDATQFEPAEPAWTPVVYCTERQAWVESPAEPNTPALRVEAGAYGGRINFVTISGPWSRPFGGARDETPVVALLSGTIILIAIGAGLVLAVHNLRQGRGDRRGGLRVTGVLLALGLADWAIGADHAGGFAHLVPALVSALGRPFFFAGMFWLMYMALEPTVRRRWPHRLVGWTRAVQGRWRDPLVGRDALIGVAFGCAWALLSTLYQTAPIWFGVAPPTNAPMLMAVRRLPLDCVVQTLLAVPVYAIFNALFAVFIPLIFYLVVRREWIAAGLSFVLWTVLLSLDAGAPSILAVVQGAAGALVVTFVALRFGLLAVAVSFMTMFLLQLVSITVDWSLWYAQAVSLATFAVLVLAAASAYVSLGGRPVLKGSLLDA